MSVKEKRVDAACNKRHCGVLYDMIPREFFFLEERGRSDKNEKG
jgi:hypothetical protein